MSEPLFQIESKHLNTISEEQKHLALNKLESGHVIYFPSYSFMPLEQEALLFSELILDSSQKNISYHYKTQRLNGLADKKSPASFVSLLQSFMHRYAEYTLELIHCILPYYKDSILWGRTSYRPAEIKGRKSSKRKDDTRLHVDSFPSTPVNGHRILRVFCNVNPYGKPRVWNLGEPFMDVLAQFSPEIPNYKPYKAKLLQLVKATKSLRTPYDHYMLELHDRMKLNDRYQSRVNKHRFDFPPFSTWIVFTDQVSHAALSGQYLLEQTFYLPVSKMAEEALSPLRLLEKEKSFSLEMT
ncbi:Kdo hydroxylase family protein [Legionella impletisoli]|uniref:3-deoxy-D-manno-oct-2-ulosonic acid (Kdo) hydroxylase n=1 Tax=Legionella impletisoli TaxID=343510 RepID=A0A917JYQ8_9GAMM|nr:Kdo hydroxylase family protein [Legionella impletisoli]GGI92785.1 hypothetical protein GCM10007966_21720 [Legionella impletisoli]